MLVVLSQIEIRGRCGTRMTALNKDCVIGSAIRFEDVVAIFDKEYISSALKFIITINYQS